ncbi:PE-PPE domain-containing protein [Mycobacterium sp.]|uniref:PE-PPE domain-containing protein n=1 Tax=Mycobacterium sp. TaxID=1785 RepID=UPI0025F5D213|nr:PE-PPE domain-containing protein [Mycobacterium sp.]
MGRRRRWLIFGMLASAGTGVLSPTATMNPAVAYADVSTDPADPATIGLVIGPSGVPIPGSGYVQAANLLYIQPNFPDTTYPDPYANGLFTPEYPVLAVPFSDNYPNATTGPLAGFPDESTSVGQGMLILDNAIASDKAAGDASTVFGWSQSSTIASLVMEQLDPNGTPEPDAGLQFVLVGDPSAPNGGLSERFDGLNTPSEGIAYDGATPANSFPTDIYTLEYDGFADYPRYPIDVLADLNADLGLVDIHGLYLSLAPTQIADEAFLLPGSEALGADTLTNYYMIDETPPLVSLLPKPLQALLGPDLTYLINLGYGADNLGYSTPANVPTEFGLFPDVSPITVFDELVAGAQQGFSAFTDDLANVSLSSLTAGASGAALSLPSMTDLVTAVSADVSDPAATLTNLADGIAGAAAALSALQLQTSDIAYAAVFSLPAYDVTLFQDNLANPIDAIGLPVAADTGLLTLAAGIELDLADAAITTAINDITGALIP